MAQDPFSIGVAAQVPVNYPAGWPVAFAAVPSAVAVVVEQSDMLGADTHWTAVTNPPVAGPGGATG